MATIAAFPAPHTIVSSSGRVYHPLSRPSTASSSNRWRPATTASGRSAPAPSPSKLPQGKDPRYAHVAAKTDTGARVDKAANQSAFSTARFKRKEVFQRIKAEKLMQLLNRGVPEILLLDLRSQQEYETNRIDGAINYPASMMSRSMYQFTPEILESKNKEGKLMVLYDLEEKLSVAVGTNWYEKGIDNFVVLTGGLLSVTVVAPELVQGELPKVAVSRPSTSMGRSPPSKASRKDVPAAGRPSGVRPSSAGVASLASRPLSGPTPVTVNPAGLRASQAGMSGVSFYSEASFDSRI